MNRSDRNAGVVAVLVIIAVTNVIHDWDDSHSVVIQLLAGDGRKREGVARGDAYAAGGRCIASKLVGSKCDGHIKGT
jgi:hypothetical protein